MPNANSPFGLKPVRDAASAPFNDGTDTYFVPSTNTTALFIGDPVIMSGDGDANGVPGITIATAGGRMTGVIVGFIPSPTIVSNGYLPAGLEGYALVDHNPNALFEVQANAVINSADIGLNADLVAGAGSTAFKRSGWQLNGATKATTATLQVRIRGFKRSPDNDVTSTNAKLLVSMNLPTETGAAGSTGL